MMGVNVLLFFVFQFGFEPWRRARLVHGFEEKVREALDKEREERVSGRNPEDLETVPIEGVLAAGIEELEVEMDGEKSPAVDAVVACIEGESEEVPAAQKTEPIESDLLTGIMKLRQPETWKAGVQDLFSPRVVQMRKQDVTIIALEGAATGAIIAIIATFLRPS